MLQCFETFKNIILNLTALPLAILTSQLYWESFYRYFPRSIITLRKVGYLIEVKLMEN